MDAECLAGDHPDAGEGHRVSGMQDFPVGCPKLSAVLVGGVCIKYWSMCGIYVCCAICEHVFASVYVHTHAGVSVCIYIWCVCGKCGCMMCMCVKIYMYDVCIHVCISVYV